MEWLAKYSRAAAAGHLEADVNQGPPPPRAPVGGRLVSSCIIHEASPLGLWLYWE